MSNVMTRCKFQCDRVSQNSNGSKDVEMSAVVSGSEENKQFWKWSPSGQFKLNCLNPDVVFEPGKQYYIYIGLAE